VTAEAASGASADLKRCCAALYGSDWARMLLGESFHPGGLALTERLGALLGLGPASRVLDAAAGRGTSAIYLARRFGCAVTGVDLAHGNVAEATEEAARADLADRVQFVAGDAEWLPFTDGSFDAVVCECALCTFPNKATACGEFRRVLRPGGRLGLSDLTRDGPLPKELTGVLAWVACVADAQPAAGYEGLLRAEGLTVDVIERHDGALRELVDRIRVRLLGAQLLIAVRRNDPPDLDLSRARDLLRSATAAISEGRLGYALLAATKPA
jgi:arsenite methyltransferase